MKTQIKIIIVAALAVTVVAAVALKQGKRESKDASTASGPGAAVPRLVDLGADKCIPCKMMAPVLEGLKKEYAGRMEVEFIDVWKNPDAGKAFGIEVIPTQIFYDASGRELFRHVGFFSKEDILAEWKQLGVELKESEARNPKPK
jgi:thioredoxin 1